MKLQVWLDKVMVTLEVVLLKAWIICVKVLLKVVSCMVRLPPARTRIALWISMRVSASEPRSWTVNSPSPLRPMDQRFN